MTLESLCADMSDESDTIMPVQFSVSSSNVSCWNDSDGKIAIDMQTNTIVPYTYILNGIPNTNPYPSDSIFDGLSTGSYTLTITDSASCYIDKIIYITAPGAPLQALTTDTSSTCHQDSTGFSYVNAVGGTPPYSYEWHNTSGVLVSTDDTASSLVGGLYYVEVIDANGCDTVSSVQILTPNTAIEVYTEIDPVICKGDSSGYIVAQAGGGFAPYTYIWSTSLGGTIQQTANSYHLNDTLQDVPQGWYTLDVIDHYGCIVSAGASLDMTEPDSVLSIDTLYLINSVECYGDNTGRALAQVSGSDSLIYSWNNGSNSLLADSLISGYHVFSVLDLRFGCEIVDSIFIPTQNTEIISTLVIDSEISCYDATDGVISVSTVGGAPSYTYDWGHINTLPGILEPTTVSNLGHGSYSLVTKDSLDCYVSDTIFISEPDPLNMEAHEVSWISCFGANDGVASASAQGGTPPYSFYWDSDTIADGHIVDTLSPGLYTVTVIDSRGCVATDTVFIHEPPLLSVSINILSDVYCLGTNTGVLQALPSGGTTFTGTSYSYTFLWDDALQASQTTQIATNLDRGTYTVTVEDARGCLASATTFLDTNETMALSVLGFDSVSCFGGMDGATSVIAQGGYVPYTYLWSGPNNFVSSSSSIHSLSNGVHTVVVTDVNGCMRNISVMIPEPDSIVFNVSGSSDELCLGACDGEIFLNSLSGGWSSSNYLALLTDNNTGITHTLPVLNNTISNVCSGDYTVSISNDDGCFSSL